MSLICWVPLTSNTLNNQGIENMSVANNGATYSSSGGKLGAGCWSFSDGTKNGHGINIYKNFTDIGSNRSICAWVYPKGNHADYAGAVVSSGNWNSSGWSFGLKRDNTGFTGFDSGYSSYYSTSIPLNTWTHLCVTVADGVTKFYKNGIYLGEQSRGSGTVNSDAPNTMIGRETYAGGYFGFNGSIQDVRIYNHTLTPQEVKEISKGLVLHYTLDEQPINRDLLNGSHQNTYNSNNEYINLFDMTSIIDTNGAGKQYTVSFDAKADINHSFNVYGSYRSNPKYSYTSSSIEVTTEWQHFSKTFTPTLHTESSTWSGVSLYGVYDSGAIIHVRNIKFELGNAETPFVLENQQIHDSSGYNNNGTIIGTLTTSTDTPRYNISTKNESLSNNVIITSNLKLEEGSITSSFWYKPINYTAGEDISKLYVKCGKFEFFTYINYPYFTWKGAGKYQYTNYWSDGNWHFVTVTSDGTTGLLYIDGNLINATNRTNIPNYGNLEITMKGCSLSDFRIYTSVLTSEDITDLYQEAAFIDHKGNVGCYQFYEDGENLLKYENTLLYTNPANTDTRGKYVIRNNELAMAFKATDTYFGSSTDKSKLLYNMFKPNTQYIFDLWIDTDDVIYDNRNVGDGFGIIYTDGTSVQQALYKVGSNPGETPKGFQHIVYVSAAGKTVESLSIYYHVSVTFYVRADSFITELSNTNIHKSGIIESGQFIEDTTIPYIGRANFNSNSLIEI